MKPYTDLNQSKKLAEILPLESADMYYDVDSYGVQTTPEVLMTSVVRKKDIPCWSLAALLDNIPQVKLDNIKQYDKKYWRCCAYFASDWHNSDWCDNPVDACYEMIIKLHEQNIL